MKHRVLVLAAHLATLVSSAVAAPLDAQGARPAATPEPRGAVTAAEPVLRLTTTEYEIYASEQQDVNATREGLDLAVSRWKQYFGALPAPLTVVVVTDPRDATTLLRDPRHRGRLILPWNQGVSARPLGHGILPHEICHVLASEHVKKYRAARGITLPDSLLPPRPSYGAPGMPDWFDEAVATLCETPDLQADRRAGQFARSRSELIPLQRLLTMEHPSFAGVIAALKKLDAESRPVQPADSAHGTKTEPSRNARPAGQGARFEVVQLPGARVAGDARDQRVWYPHVAVFADWLVERAGPGVLRSLLDAYASLQPIEVVLRAEPHLPDDVDTLAAEWNAWVEHQR